MMIHFIVFAQNEGNIMLKKGEKFIVENKINVLSKQDLMGQSMESNADMSTLYNIEVINSKDSGYSLNNTFSKMKASMSAMGQDMNFDTEKKEDMNGDLAGKLKDVINNPQVVMMDRSGKIFAKKKTDTAKGAKPDVMLMMMQQFVGDPAEGGYGASLAFINIPKKSAVGYTWTDSSTVEGIKKSTTYRITQIKGTEATISITGILNTDIKTEMQGMELTTKTTGTLKGNEVTDISTGIVKEKNTTLESSGTIQVMGQEIPMTTKVSSSTTVKRL